MNNDYSYLRALEQIGSKFASTTGQSISFIDREGEWQGRLNLKSFSSFCRRVISSEDGRAQCSQCNNAFEKTKDGCIDISRCHMGVTVISVPVKSENNNLLLSYGQFLQQETRDDFFNALPRNSKRLGIEYSELLALASDLKVFSKSELDDRIELLQLFSSYVSITENELKSHDQYYRECQKKMEIENRLSALELDALNAQINQAFITEALTVAVNSAYKEHAEYTADLLYNLLHILVKSSEIKRLGATSQEQAEFAEEYRQISTAITQAKRDIPENQQQIDATLQDKSKVALKATAIILARFTEHLSLESVAKELHISPVYLSRVFKEKASINFKEYLIQVRMKEAKKLLEDGHYSVSEVALKSGYEDASYFCKAYKKQYGYTPKNTK